MAYTTKQLDFVRRKENVHKVGEAIGFIEKKIKGAIIKEGLSTNTKEKQELENEIDVCTRILSGLVIVWSEAMIKWLCYEHGAFEDAQITELVQENKPLEQKWTSAITIAFYKAFSGENYNLLAPIQKKKDILDCGAINKADKELFESLYNLVETKIVPAITIRNKIQHGDWVNAFKTDKNTKLTSYDSSLSTKVEGDNILRLKLKRNQIKGIYDIIRDLATFKKTGEFKLDAETTPFAHFFGKRYRNIIENEKKIDTADFQEYKDILIKNAINGQKWRRQNEF